MRLTFLIVICSLFVNTTFSQEDSVDIFIPNSFTSDGDGLNDAPALAAATASLSPATGADVTQAAADAVFTGKSLSPVLDLLVLTQKGRRVMIENFGLALIYNLIAVPLAIFGYVTPLIAAAAMSGSSVIVALNALRARRAKGMSS